MQRVKDKELIEWVCSSCAATFESDEYKNIEINGEERIQDVCPVCKTIVEAPKP